MNQTKDTVVLYHNTFSRARVIHWLLEELEAPYELKIMDFEKGDLEKPEFLKLNPMGRIPVIEHRDTVVTETAAICIYLADYFKNKGLAPSLDSKLRGPYLRWIFFAVNCVEPAVVDHKFPRAGETPYASIGYGTLDETLAILKKALAPGPFILGSQFSAADVYISSLIGWYIMTKAVDSCPEFERYLAACHSRPAAQRISQN